MKARTARLRRQTKETDVEIVLTLDGTGIGKVECEDQFLRHMMETLTKYASFDLELKAVGDDRHHLIEDVGIVLGLALRQAIGDKPIERVAYATVPMDDAVVTAAIDMIGRPYVDIDCPDDLCLHFFRSFAMSAGITLHIMVERGFDEHHIIEAGFKALGMSLRKATIPRAALLSTKDKPKTRRK